MDCDFNWRGLFAPSERATLVLARKLVKNFVANLGVASPASHTSCLTECVLVTPNEDNKKEIRQTARHTTDPAGLIRNREEFEGV